MAERQHDLIKSAYDMLPFFADQQKPIFKKWNKRKGAKPPVWSNIPYFPYSLQPGKQLLFTYYCFVIFHVHMDNKNENDTYRIDYETLSNNLKET